MAQRDGVDWLLHVDTDELIYPSGSPDFSLQARTRLVLQCSPDSDTWLRKLVAAGVQTMLRWGNRVSLLHPPLQEVLAKVPPDVDTLVFPNYESLPERDDVVDPFTEVTLFKKNYAHVVSGGLQGCSCSSCSSSSAACMRAVTHAQHTVPCRPVLQVVWCCGPRQPQLLHHLRQWQVGCTSAARHAPQRRAPLALLPEDSQVSEDVCCDPIPLLCAHGSPCPPSPCLNCMTCASILHPPCALSAHSLTVPCTCNWVQGVEQ